MRLHRSRRRLIFGSCLVAGFCAAATASAHEPGAAGQAANAPAQPGPADTPGTDNGSDAPGVKVTVSLADGLISRRLPFDVPFYMTGSVTGAITGVESLVYRISSKAMVTSVIAELRRSNCLAPPNIASTRLVSHSEWTGPPQSTFTLLVEPLAPQRYYAFCFITTGPVPSAEIEPAARQALADTMRVLFGTRRPGNLTEELAKNFRDRFSMSIEEIGARRPKPAVIPVGNPFHKDAVIERESRLARLLSELVDPYQEMSDAQYRSVLDALGDVVRRSSDLLSAEVKNALPNAAGNQLPNRDQAILSSTPFNVAAYTFENALRLVRNALEAARNAGNTAAATALQEIETNLTRLATIAPAYGSTYDQLRGAAQLAIGEVVLLSRDITIGLNSSVLSAELNRTAYVSMDVGFAYAWQLESFVFYAGTNIYFRPVNKNAPLSASFASRVAFTIGVTTTVNDPSRRAEDLRPGSGQNTTTNSLMLGGGLRITPSLRVGAGALVFKESDPNPLITQKSVAATPYVSLSLDVDLGTLLSGMFPK